MSNLNTKPSDRELLAAIVQRLVDDPEAVRVEEHDHGDANTYLTVWVAPHDRGKVIGREGVTAQALRVLFGRMAAVTGRKTFLELPA